MNDLSLIVARTIKAPIERVYNAWLDPALLAKFMVPGEGMSVLGVETDPRVGGQFQIVMKAGEEEWPHTGEYKELSPHSRIVFTWESAYSVDGSTVTVDLKEVEEGTHVELTHVKFLSEDSHANHKAGWTVILEKLDEVVR